MKDNHVDELLDDLDRALSVQPSPALTARIRTEIARQPVRQTPWVKWMAGAAAAGLAMVIYATWTGHQSKVQESRVQGAAVQESTVQGSPLPPEASVQPRAVEGKTPRVTTAANREPEVLISPDVAMAVAQLRRDVASGRFVVTEFREAPSDLSPTVIEPSLLVLPLFRIDTVALEPVSPGPGSGRTEEKNVLDPLLGPQSRTRSTL